MLKYLKPRQNYRRFGSELLRFVELPRLPDTLPVMLIGAFPVGVPCIDVDL